MAEIQKFVSENKYSILALLTIIFGIIAIIIVSEYFSKMEKDKDQSGPFLIEI